MTGFRLALAIGLAVMWCRYVAAPALRRALSLLGRKLD
jgi:hypothetical protein